jgi:multidrug efflux pump
MGVIPLVIASGAGSEVRRAMGVAVFSGMIGVTFFGLFLTPVFFVLIRRFVGRGGRAAVMRPASVHQGGTPAALPPASEGSHHA